MVRKLAGTLATIGMLSSPFALGLGLGEAELLSSLNQPLNAKIQLAQTEGVSASEIRVKLASESAFAKAGLDRQFFLQNLNFSVRQGANGAYIELSSKTPVKEPFLNFLLEVEWPQGQLMREYTFLLDPPSYTTPTTALAQNNPTARPLAAPAAGNLVDEGARRIKTTATDTLWSLARKNRPNNNITIKQAMLAIQEANPDAFPTANINNMETGSTLLIPSEKAMLKRNELDAIREVARQNQAWVALKKATPAPVEADTKPTAEPTDKLTLVSDKPVDTAKANTNTAEMDQQAVKDESADQAQRENAELSSRLDELQKQVGTLQKLIRLKDEQLAAMETMLAKQNELLAGKKPVATVEEAPTENAMPAAPVAMVGAAATGQPAAGAIGLDLAAEANKANSEVKVEAAPVATPVEAKPVAQPIKPFVIEKQEQESLDPSTFLVDSLKKNALMLGGAAAAILALVLLLMVMRRRKANTPKVASSGADVASSGAAAAVGAGAAVAGAAALDSLDDNLGSDLDLGNDFSADLEDDMTLGDLSLDDIGESDNDNFADTELDNLEFDSLDNSSFDSGEPALELDDDLSTTDLSDDLSDDLNDSFGEMDFELDDLASDDMPSETTASTDTTDDTLDDLDLGELDLGELDFDLDDETEQEGAELQIPFAQAESMAENLMADDANKVDMLAQDNLDNTASDNDLIDLELNALDELMLPELDHMDSDNTESNTIDFEADAIDLSDEIEAEAEYLKNDHSSSQANRESVLEPLDLNFDDEQDQEIEETQEDIAEQDDNAEEISEALDEAETYLANGQPVQAAAVLQRALTEIPDSNELRLKFMETLVELKDEATFDHELRALQNSGDISSLTAALALQSKLYAETDHSVAALDADDNFEALDILDLGNNDTNIDPSIDGDIDLNSELDALERDFGRYAESTSSSTDELDEMDLELVDLDLDEESESDDEPLINLNPIDLGTPDTLDDEDFELTDLDLSDDELGLSDDEFDYELDSALKDELEKTQQNLNNNADVSVEDLGEIEAEDDAVYDLSGIESLVDQDLSDDDLIDLSPSLDELSDLNSLDDLGSLDDLADISMTENDLLDDDNDTLSIDDILDENEDPAIKLDLARAYIDMGNTSSALDALTEVIERGNSDQKASAQKLMDSLQS